VGRIVAFCPSAAAEIERRSAESKFFRSLAPVSLCAAVVLLTKGNATIGALAVLVAGFSLWRYADRRWYAAQLTYEYYLLLSTVSAKTPSGSAALEPPKVLSRVDIDFTRQEASR
jgi:hypothetical protein